MLWLWWFEISFSIKLLNIDLEQFTAFFFKQMIVMRTIAFLYFQNTFSSLVDSFEADITMFIEQVKIEKRRIFQKCVFRIWAIYHLNEIIFESHTKRAVNLHFGSEICVVNNWKTVKRVIFRYICVFKQL